MEINGRSLSIMSEAIGGSNVADCQHACLSQPCGSLAKCIPNFENYECVCSRFNEKCNHGDINKTIDIANKNDTNIVERQNSSKKSDNIDASRVRTPSSVETIPSTQKPQSESPAIINNPIEVSVVVPAIDVTDDEFVNPPTISISANREAANLVNDREYARYNPFKRRTQMKHKSKYSKRRNGVCFSGDESYFNYHDEETKRRIINYNVDLNLRMKTYSTNGLILWAGPHSGLGDGDYLMLGIENG